MPDFPDNIILFDGVCNLCNGAVRFVVKRDKKKIMNFASLQSDSGKLLLEKYGLSTTELDTFVYIKNRQAFTRSTAGFMVLHDLGGIWKLFSLLKVFPNFMLDFFYNCIAKSRYRIFGKRDKCSIMEID